MVTLCSVKVLNQTVKESDRKNLRLFVLISERLSNDSLDSEKRQLTVYYINMFFRVIDIWDYSKYNALQNFIYLSNWNNFYTERKRIRIPVQCRSSRPEVFCKKGVLRNFTRFTRKRLCQSLFFNKVAGLRPMNFVKFLRTPFFIENLRWLLLFIEYLW